MKVLDTCSGIGMAAYGLEQAGMTIEAFCEFDPKPCKVLNKHWPRVPIYPDLTKLTAEQFKNDGLTADVISSGFPCQPYSRASAGYNKRGGRSDDRDLSGHVIRLVEEFKPAWFLGENTEGFVDIGLASFVDELEEKGYLSESFSIPACSVGLPTLERHVWIVSTTCRKRLQRCVEKTLSGFEALQGQFRGSDTRIPDRWRLPESRLFGVGEGNPGRMDRLKQIGNAVDPKVVEVIGRAMMEAV